MAQYIIGLLNLTIKTSLLLWFFIVLPNVNIEVDFSEKMEVYIIGYTIIFIVLAIIITIVHIFIGIKKLYEQIKK